MNLILKWDEVTIPDEWVVDSQPILKPIEEKKVEQIIEEPDGRVLISFNPLDHHVLFQVLKRIIFLLHLPIKFSKKLQFLK